MKQMIKDILVMLSFYLGIFILFVIVTRSMINHSGLAWTMIGIMAFMVLLGMLSASPGTGHVLDNAFSCLIVGILLILSSLALNTTWNQMEAKEARAKQSIQVQPEGSKQRTYRDAGLLPLIVPDWPVCAGTDLTMSPVYCVSAPIPCMIKVIKSMNFIS